MNPVNLSWLLPLSIAVPFLLAVLLGFPGARKWMTKFMVLAPLPALVTAVWAMVHDGADIVLDLPWLLIGSRLVLDDTGQLFLLLTALIWLSSAMFAVRDIAAVQNRVRFGLSFLVALTGNIAVTIAADVVTFYTAFALMSFAAYGLIVTSDDKAVVRAGRVYIALVVIGELMLFSAFVTGVNTSGSIYLAQWHSAMHVAITVTFIIMGFGIKLGVIPWHFVLPISYQAAPYSAAVALGGAMLNAGMLGWLRFLPLGHSASPDWGVALIVLGMLASFLGVVLGVFQKNPKALLGYSSVSQVGLMTVIVGVALVDPGQWKILSAVLLIYVFHHALAKGALFYAAGFRTALSKPVYYWMCFALLLPALSIAGAPLTSGALAKSGFKTVLPALPEPWSMWLVYLLPLSSVATSLLLMRFIFMVWPQRVRAPGSPDTALYGQVLLTLAVAIMAWLFASVNGGQTVAVALKAASLWASSWPLMAAIILAAVAVWLGKRFNLRLRVLPAGDLLLPIESILRYALKLLLRLALFIETMWSRTKLSLNASLLDESLQASERILRSPVTVGVMFILMFLGILLTLGILLNR